jgi:integrase
MQPKKRKSQKGARFTSDYIPWERAILKGNELLWSEKQSTLGFYIIFALNTGLRVSDILARKHSELAMLKKGDHLTIVEHKTRNHNGHPARQIQVNQRIIEAYTYLVGQLTKKGKYIPDDYIFRSQRGGVLRIESLNTLLKSVFAGEAKNISTHSLRKSFGRHVYEINGNSEDALIKLSEMFQHSSMAMTRRYLGIRQEELDNIYMNL